MATLFGRSESAFEPCRVVQRDLKYTEAMELIRESYSLVHGEANGRENLEGWSMKDSAAGRRVITPPPPPPPLRYCAPLWTFLVLKIPTAIGRHHGPSVQPAVLPLRLFTAVSWTTKLDLTLHSSFSNKGTCK